MKNKINKSVISKWTSLALAIFLLLTQTACFEFEKKIDVPSTNGNRLVVQVDFNYENANLVPIFVTRTNDVGKYITFNQSLDPRTGQYIEIDTVAGARVFIYKNDILLREIKHRAQDPNFTFTTQSLPPFEEGAIYKLQVTAPGFETIEAIQKAPQYVPLKGLKFNNASITLDNSRVLSEIVLEIDDPSNQENYYTIGAIQTDSSSNGLYSYTTRFEKLDPVSTSTEVIGDKTFNGQKYFWRLGTDQIMDLNNPSNRKLKFTFSTVSAEYERYIRANDNIIKAGNNPFVEPVAPYTNVKNGFGFFNIRGKKSTFTIKL
jgi:hypothetical protein